MTSDADTAPRTLGAHEVHVWYVFSDRLTDPDLLARYEALLSAEEHARRRRFVFAKDRHQFLVTRALARTTLSRYRPVPPQTWTFTTNAYGRPEVAGPCGSPALHFNLSHTAGLIACAVALGREVGVDVEDVTRPGEYADLAARFFAPSEAERVRSLDGAARQEAFFDYWTLKESYIKARGMGLALPLTDFAFVLRPGASVGITFSGTIDDDPASWHFAQLRPSARHKLALAVRRSGGEALAVLAQETLPAAT